MRFGKLNVEYLAARAQGLRLKKKEARASPPNAIKICCGAALIEGLG